MGNVLCLISDPFADFEVVLALHLLRDTGRKILTVGYSRDPVTSQSGLRYAVDLTLDEAAALGDVEAFVMPGGPLRERNEQLVSFLQKLDRQGTLLAAICFGPQYLARSGLLETRRYTTSCTPEHIRRLGVRDPFPRGQFVDERVVTDGNVITAQGHAFVDFAFAILRKAGFDPSDEDGLERYRRDIMDR